MYDEEDMYVYDIERACITIARYAKKEKGYINNG